MPYGMNHGWGRILADSVLTSRPHTGKKYLVMASSNPNWDRYTQMLPLHPEGTVSVHATISAAITAASDAEDAVIYVAAGHNESVVAAAGIVVNKAHLSIVGLGEGDARPNIQFATATTADLDVNQPNCTFENLRFDLTGVDAVAAPLDINAAKCTFRECEFTLANASRQATTAIVTDSTATGLHVDRCNFFGPDITGVVTAIRFVGADEHVIERSNFNAHFKKTTGAISVTTTAASVIVKDCVLRNLGYNSSVALDFLRDSTAVITGCAIGVASGSNPITVNEGTTYFGKGSIVTMGNWYRSGTTVAAGTLL